MRILELVRLEPIVSLSARPTVHNMGLLLISDADRTLLPKLNADCIANGLARSADSVRRAEKCSQG